jgi:Transmembrane Fragile-X-F protein
MVQVPPLRYAGTVFTARVERPRSIAGRLWNRAQAVASIVPLTFLVLKLTGVITWSWWWVLSPLWISGILSVLALCGLLLLLRWEARGQMRMHAHHWREWCESLNANQDASGGDLGLQDGRGETL